MLVAWAIYPATQHYISDLPSYTEHAKTGLVPARNMRWFCDTYLDGMAPADPALEKNVSWTQNNTQPLSKNAHYYR